MQRGSLGGWPAFKAEGFVSGGKERLRATVLEMLSSLNSSRVPEHLDMREGDGREKERRGERRGQEKKIKERGRGRNGRGEVRGRKGKGGKERRKEGMAGERGEEERRGKER